MLHGGGGGGMQGQAFFFNTKFGQYDKIGGGGIVHSNQNTVHKKKGNP